LIAGAAPGQDIVATAKAGAAAGEAKEEAKAEKAEKPEIAREAARIGREIGADVHDAILRRAAKKESDEKIRGGLAGQVGRVVAEGGVDPDIMADVAAKIIGDELGKVRAEQAAKGGVNPQTARAILGERQVKAAGQEQARERGVERVQGAAARPAVARQIFAEFGGNVSPEQATVGAEKYQQLLSRGENPMIAAQKVMADMFGVLQENLNTMGAMTGMFEQVQGMVAMARQRQQAIESVVARLEGKLKSQRWVKPPPWGTIGGG
jgi:BMFP domain-containing protein YqiC